jgi:hypothetical protein
LRHIKDDCYTYTGSYRDFILAKKVLRGVSLAYGGAK